MGVQGLFVAGHYSVTWDGEDIGTTEEGFEIRPSHFREDIKIDDLGDTVVDGVYRGGQAGIVANLSEWNKAAREKIQFPYFDRVIIGSETEFRLGNVGAIIVSGSGPGVGEFAKALVFTPIFASLKPYTFPLVMPEPDHGAWSFNNRLRRWALNMIAVPDRQNFDNLFKRGN